MSRLMGIYNVVLCRLLTTQAQSTNVAIVSFVANAEIEVPLKFAKEKPTKVMFSSGYVESMDSEMRTCCVPPEMTQVLARPPSPQRKVISFRTGRRVVAPSNVVSGHRMYEYEGNGSSPSNMILCSSCCISSLIAVIESYPSTPDTGHDTVLCDLTLLIL